MSPFLLISKTPSDWPRGADKHDIAFSDFHSVESRDLPRIFNTVTETRLPEVFVTQLEELRKLRNAITHTINKKLRVTARDVVLHILRASSTLLGPRKWIYHRRVYLENNHDTVLYSGDENSYRIALEMKTIVDFLDRSDLMAFFGFDKKRRKYQCPGCYHSSDMVPFEHALAVLEPNTPQSTTIRCFVCEQSVEIVRQKCTNSECQGNVIWVEDNQCLTCGAFQDNSG